MSQRVLFLMSDTGGGHRASANALGEALDRLHGDALRWELVDLFADYGAWPLNQIPRAYLPLVSDYGWLWRLLWWAGSSRFIWQLTTATMVRWHRSRLRRCFQEHPADLVVSVHPLLNHAPLRVLRECCSATPFATVVTDLSSAPDVWYNPQVDLLCAPCPEVQQTALAAGLPPARTCLAGLPISLRFLDAPRGQAQLRRQLGLLDRPTVLLVGGGEGMGAVAEIADALAKALAERGAQLLVICGRNEALRRRLAARPWPMPVRLTGFVPDMPAWMAAADCIVTKAGPGTIAEALASGLPIMLSGYVYGQEAGNVDFVVENRVGAFSQEPAEIARIVREWLEPGNAVLAAMKQRTRELARPQAALEIAQALSKLLD